MRLEEFENCRELECRHCRSCVCDRIRRLEFNERVTLFLKSSRTIEDVRFVCFKERECCAEFVRHHEGHDELFLVNCKDIVAIRIRSSSSHPSGPPSA